ncbi:P80 family lipoprotein [Metamycoplasma subdolum]|uniref:P68 family surface lipoprotein n=1 Tax=Metamycoplasma subdolum TaxID=92407 RepID=UPI00298BD3D8|nr:P80 family lipoprotein [Metamycoplasma subdolum]WPB50615.1 P80 family lipoprotein [Metamycoplasma subdolum]
MKTKKILFALAPLAVATLPLVGASCGGGNTSTKFLFDQQDDGRIKLYSGFATSAPQGAGLRTIVAEFNKFAKTSEAKAAGYLPVDVAVGSNGYSTEELKNKLEAKDDKQFFNLMTNYATASSIIARYRMNLDFSKDFESYGLHPLFKNVNDQIAGIKSHERWVVPISRSSEMMSINKPVLGKLLYTLTQAPYNVQLEGTHTLIDEMIKSYTTGSDKAAVDKKWDPTLLPDGPDKNAVVAMLKDYKLSDAIFESYTELLKFAELSKLAFSKQDAPETKTRFVVGFDSIPNTIYAMSLSLAGGDKSKTFITYHPKDEKYAKFGGFDFASFRENEASPEHKNFKASWEILLPAIEKKAVYVGGGGAYGSGPLTIHEMAILIGSTAGYVHTFISDGAGGKTIFALDSANGKIGKELKSTFKLNLVDTTGTEVIALFQNEKFENPIVRHNAPQAKGEHGWMFVDKESEDKALAIFKAGDYLVVDDTLTHDGDVVKKDGKEIPNAKYLGKILNGKGASTLDFYYIPSTKILIDSTSGTENLNFDEAMWKSVPLKANTDAASTFSVTAQGPSFIGIHANEREDKATKLFVKWFFTHQLKDFKAFAQTFNGNPIDVFNGLGSYVSTTSAWFSQDPGKIKLNAANRVAFDNFRKAMNDKNYHLVEDVAASQSQILRDTMTTLGKNAMDSASNGQPHDFKSLLKKFKQILGTRLD